MGNHITPGLDRMLRVHATRERQEAESKAMDDIRMRSAARMVIGSTSRAVERYVSQIIPDENDGHRLIARARTAGLISLLGCSDNSQGYPSTPLVVMGRNVRYDVSDYAEVGLRLGRVGLRPDFDIEDLTAARARDLPEDAITEAEVHAYVRKDGQRMLPAGVISAWLADEPISESVRSWRRYSPAAQVGDLAQAMMATMFDREFGAPFYNMTFIEGVSPELAEAVRTPAVLVQDFRKAFSLPNWLQPTESPAA